MVSLVCLTSPVHCWQRAVQWFSDYGQSPNSSLVQWGGGGVGGVENESILFCNENIWQNSDANPYLGRIELESLFIISDKNEHALGLVSEAETKKKKSMPESV